MNTADLTNAIILAASERGHLLARNNSGVAKAKNKDGSIRYTRYGVGPVGGGGGDLIGLSRDGIFLSVEIKVGKDRQTDKQKMWQQWVVMRGGRAGVARSVEDAIKIMEGVNG